MSSLGRKLVLWRVEHRAAAYKDQFGRVHTALVIVEEIPVTITEVKMIPGNYSAKLYEGFLATSEDGRTFTCNWEGKFPEESISPTWRWWDGKAKIFFDACQLFNVSAGYPCITKDGNLAIPAGATYCEEHNFVFLPDGIGCITCMYARAHD